MIQLFPKALTPAECESLKSRFIWAKHGVIDHNAADVGLLVNRRTGLDFRWTNKITLSTQEVPWHLDHAMGATHKACIYLLEGPGTEFKTGEVRGGGLGDIVVFHIALVHRTAPGLVGERRVLGLRGISRDDEPTVRTSIPPTR